MSLSWRTLMDEIDWRGRLIGIRGAAPVNKGVSAGDSEGAV